MDHFMLICLVILVQCFFPFNVHAAVNRKNKSRTRGGEITCFCSACRERYCVTDGVCTLQENREPDGKILQTYSCLQKYQLIPDERDPFNCRDNPRTRDIFAIKCCNTEDLCNLSLNVSLADIPLATTASSSFIDDGRLYATIAGVVLCLVIAGLIMAYLFVRVRHRTASPVPRKDEVQRLLEEGAITPGMLSCMVDEFTTSGSGSGLPLLIQRTIARQVTLGKTIGKGRFGEVYLGRWHGESVAVKIFSSRDEDSWRREVEIYQTTMLRHENILGFIAADNKDSGLSTQLWLITEYHENGSLFDFLSENPIDVKTMLRLAFTFVNGLSHLHMDIVGTSTSGKPPIAHRDLKSKNILVKRNGQCCIADLGLAVRYQSAIRHIDIPQNSKVGTVRYLAPEVLDGNLNMKNFEALKAADIYASALILWEICNRCQLRNSVVQTYELPFQHEVPGDPDIPQMREIVFVQKKRPVIHNNWNLKEPMITMTRLMRECWFPNAQARLTALRLKKTMAQLVAMEDVKI